MGWSSTQGLTKLQSRCPRAWSPYVVIVSPPQPGAAIFQASRPSLWAGTNEGVHQGRNPEPAMLGWAPVCSPGTRCPSWELRSHHLHPRASLPRAAEEGWSVGTEGS